MIGTLLWLVVSLVFKFYVANFADYNATYGVTANSDRRWRAGAAGAHQLGPSAQHQAIAGSGERWRRMLGDLASTDVRFSLRPRVSDSTGYPKFRFVMVHSPRR